MFKGFFKPLSKRDAKIAAVIFGITLVVLVYELLRQIFAGTTFDDLRNTLLLTVFAAIVEFSMITIVTSRDKDGDKSEEAKELPEAVSAEGSDEREGSEEFTEGLSEEFGTDTDPEGADAGAEGGEAGAEGGEGGAEG